MTGPITHILTDTVSSDEDYNGDCDRCLIPLSADYVSYLLGWMAELRRLHQLDPSVHNIRCRDSRPQYFRSNDQREPLRDSDGNPVDAPLDAPALLAADPGLAPQEFQDVEAQTVQISREEVWWSAYVKHTNVKVESAAVDRQTLRKIQESWGGAQAGNPTREPIHPAVQMIHDLLYLDVQGSQRFYNPDKPWDADTLARITVLVTDKAAGVAIITRRQDTSHADLERSRSIHVAFLCRWRCTWTPVVDSKGLLPHEHADSNEFTRIHVRVQCFCATRHSEKHALSCHERSRCQRQGIWPYSTRHVPRPEDLSGLGGPLRPWQSCSEAAWAPRPCGQALR